MEDVDLLIGRIDSRDEWGLLAFAVGERKIGRGGREDLQERLKQRDV